MLNKTSMHKQLCLLNFAYSVIITFRKTIPDLPRFVWHHNKDHNLCYNLLNLGKFTDVT